MAATTDELADPWPLPAQFPDADAATCELDRTAAVLTLRRGAVHVISDVHGEDRKLRHVINNAGGTLRPLNERLLGDRQAGPELEAFVRRTVADAGRGRIRKAKVAQFEWLVDPYRRGAVPVHAGVAAFR